MGRSLGSLLPSCFHPLSSNGNVLWYPKSQHPFCAPKSASQSLIHLCKQFPEMNDPK
jgi:hypothetical protein